MGDSDKTMNAAQIGDRVLSKKGTWGQAKVETKRAPGAAEARNKAAVAKAKRSHPSSRRAAGKQPGAMVGFTPYTDEVRQKKNKARKEILDARKSSYYDGSK